MNLRAHTPECIGFILTLFILPCTSDGASSDEGYRQLFKQVNGSLPEADQRAVYAALGLAASQDGSALIFKDMECPAFVFDEVTVRDLDGDGQAEVMLRGGNTCTSGGNGSSLWLLTKSAHGG